MISNSLWLLISKVVLKILPFRPPIAISRSWGWICSLYSLEYTWHFLGFFCFVFFCVCTQLLSLCDLMDCSPSRPLYPWNFPDKTTGLGCYFLLRGSSRPRDWPTSLASPALAMDSLPLVPAGKPFFGGQGNVYPKYLNFILVFWVNV